MPEGDELRAQLPVVVDLAVEDHANRAVFVADRLVAAGKVDDAQPAHAERRAVADEHALVVWAAVTDDVTHPPQAMRRGVS